MAASVGESAPFLLWQAMGWRCALPLAHVVETLRPLEIRPLSGVPAFVCGASVVRGCAVPVIDAAALLGAVAAQPAARWIIVKNARGPIALAVARVFGVQALPLAGLQGLPPILGGSGAGPLAALAALDAELLGVLESGRILPDSVWTALSPGAAS